MKKYIVHLTEAEQNELEEYVRQQKGTHLQVRRAQILLKANVTNPDKSWNDQQISDAFDCTINAVQLIRKHFCERGLQSTMAGLPHRKKAKLLDGEQEAQIIALRLNEPPQGYNGWTLRLLAEKAVELQICEHISHQTVKKLLKKQI